MLLDPQDGLYVFELTLGFNAGGEDQFTTPYLVQADDVEEAEEKVLEYLDDMDLDQEFWIEEMSEPFNIEEYSQKLEDGELQPFPLLGELTEEEFKGMIGY